MKSAGLVEPHLGDVTEGSPFRGGDTSDLEERLHGPL